MTAQPQANPHRNASVPSDDLAGKRVIVTGAGGGIGRATVLMAVSRGASVLCLDLAEGGLAETIRLAEELAPEVRTASAVVDCSDFGEVSRALAEVAENWGGFDCLANVAGIMFAKPLAECELADIDRIFRVNVGAMLMTSRAALPWLPAGSVIVNVSSANAQHVTAGLGVYGASKAANLYLTRVFALEFAEHGVRVCGLGPGAVDTAMPRSFMPAGDEGERLLAEAVAGAQVVPRMAQPEEIAKAIGYLISDEASFIIGSTLWIDGGTTATQ